MSNLQMIEMLCNLVEQQSKVISHFAMQLERSRNLTEAEQQMIDATKRKYTAILGDEETPDFPL